MWPSDSSIKAVVMPQREQSLWYFIFHSQVGTMLKIVLFGKINGNKSMRNITKLIINHTMIKAFFISSEFISLFLQ